MDHEEKIPLSRIDFTGLEGEFFDRFVQLLGRLALLNAVDYGSLLTGVYRAVTAAAYTLLQSDTAITANFAGIVTLTLPPAKSNNGRSLWIRTITANTVVSASGNVVPLAGGAAGTAILAAAAGKWALLWSDGTNWQIQASN